MGEPGVDSVGLFSFMCYFLYLKHDALAQQLCGFVSCSSPSIDPMQCECHGSWYSQKSDVFLTISRTTHHVRGSTSTCSCAGGDDPMSVCVCAQRGERLLCGRSVHQVCSCWSEMLTVLDRTLVVWHILPYSALLTVSLCDT